jgi:hypothetical protein
MRSSQHTFAVELFKRGVAIETVSMLLGYSSIKVTEKHYKPWVKTLQDRLATDAPTIAEILNWQPRRNSAPHNNPLRIKLGLSCRLQPRH